jgi:hypothetical protein
MGTRIWEKTFPQEIAEGTTAAFTDGVLKDELGVAVPAANVNTIKLWLYKSLGATAPSTFLNSRNGQSILNANGGTLDASGNFVLTLSPADNVLASQAVASEPHDAYIEVTYNGGAKTARILWHFNVVNLPVPVV